ncbi:hemagglutinin repeat-containing protein [Limnobaculum parvum]|uniref:Filamentous hemagglutinin N-terminal domain-containing protein n=1 Tax=Limnobaculum parvum TaxID=2172103 RepID=A0A2Y9U018_9GAMM|nr:hemagglutinin repeat-containing protein [Limnobaculum parvum]AWH89378.1 filamentous hemagglutinin N-terminal domain-containing protein [Limnobaculum parvum]
MNKNLYRVIFNQARGQLMVVPEIAGAHTAGGTPRASSGGGHPLSQLIAGLKPLTLLTSLALGLMTISLPAQADIVADHSAPGNQQPTVISSANGTPQVNIQTPSDAGVSRNTYSQFDVDNRGAILNNSAAPVQTQLGGYVDGNPQVIRGGAKIILNEVNSRDPSQLNGYVEVAGQKAQVVIANPSGITCDGCGFINANRATLTTGTPNLVNGQLEGYNVQQGNVTIQGRGMDSSQQSYTDIIARSVRVNAGVWANELNVVTGKNKVSADTSQIEKQGGNEAGSPQFSVDVAVLGGMYANSIRMVGTENGVGVHNAGHIGTQAGSVVVTTDGRIENSGTMSSAQDLTLSTPESLTNSGTLFGKNTVQINAQGDIVNTAAGQMGTNGQLDVTTQGSLTTQGVMAADGNTTVSSRRGLNNGGTVSAGQTLRVSGASIDNSGTLQGKGRTAISTPGYINQTASGKISSTGFLSLDSGDWMTSYGSIYSADAASISVQNALFNGGTLDTGLGLTLSASHINNAGAIYAGSDVQAQSRSDLLNSGTLGSDRDITLNAAGAFASSNTLYAKGDVRLAAGSTVSNNGTLAADGHLSLTTPGALNNNGTLYSKGNLTLSADQSVTSYGGIGADGELSLSTDGTLFNNQMLYGKGQTTLKTGGDVTNLGVIGSDSRLSLTTPGNLLNTGTLYSGGPMTVTTNGRITNGGTVNSGSDLILTGQNSLYNGNTIYAKGHANLNISGAVTNDGTIGADRNLTLKAGEDTLNNGTLYSQGAGKYLTEGSFTNNRLLRSEDTLSVEVGGSLLNDADIYASAGLDFSAGQRMDNHAQIYSGGALNLHAIGDISNTSVLAAFSDMTLSTTHFSNGSNALLASGVQSNGQRVNTGDITLVSAQPADLQGQVLASGTFNVDANGINLADGLVSAGAMNLQGHGGEINTDRAQLYVNNAFTAQTTGHWSNLGGQLYAGDMQLKAGSLTNDAAGIISAQSTNLTLNGLLSNRGLIDGLLTRLQASQIDNYGTGRIYGTWLGLQADVINNREEGSTAATIAGRETLDMGAGTLNNYTHSLIFSGGNMSIGRLLDDNGNATGMGGTLNNHSATIEALGDLRLSVGVVNNVNDHFSTEVREISREDFHDFTLKGSVNRYTLNELSFYKDGNGIKNILSPENPTWGKDNFYEYIYTRITKETVISETDPAKILAGGNLLMTADTVNNDKSQIVAGNVLNIAANTLNNTEVTGTRTIDEIGKVTHWSRQRRSGKDKQKKPTTDYIPAQVVQSITLKPSETLSNTLPNGSGTSIAGRQEGITPNANINGINIERVNIQLPGEDGMKDVGVVTRPPSLNLTLPNASLYKVNPAVGSRYLIETDPQYTQLKRWLGSDYMTSRLKADPNNMHKRLGDGYYEQTLIREQVINLTGQRFLNGYANDEEQYMALMNSGVEFAQKYPLSLGIALTPEQMANLTSDIVWLVSRDVTLPDGSVQTVLVPQVYAMIRPQDIDGSGALLSGKQVNLQLTNDLVNQGRILAGDKLNVLAQNIQNQGGSISGNNVMLLANNDINNIGGLMQGFDSLRLQAGHDINLITTTTQGEKAGRNGSSHTAINQVAALAVNNDNGTLQLSAGHDINLTAALLSNAGQNSDTTIEAGHNLNLSTVTEEKQRSYVWDKDNYRHEGSSQDVGTQITGGGNITLAAKNDVNARASQVESGGQLAVVAGNDINIMAGQSSAHLDEHTKSSGKGGGGMTKVTNESHSKLDYQYAESSRFDGNSVVMNAGNNLLVHGSEVIATNDLTLKAGNNLTITSAQETSDERRMERETRSGLMGSGGIGFTVGKIDEKSTNTVHGISNVGSTIGSTNGSVSLSAGNNLAVKGSDVVAQQDISLTGKNVTVESVENQTHIQDKYERTQSGVTVALSGAVGGALNAAVTEAKQAQETHDSKIKALQEIKAALSAVQAVQAGMMDLPKDSEGFVGISISGGAQRTESTTDTKIRAAQGSTIAAGNNLSITATGNGEKGVDGDITLKGSAINAGNNMLLDANRDVNLLASANTQKTDSENKSYGGNAGVSFGIGGGKNGLRFFADANFSQGNMHADGLYWTESQLEAGNNLTIISGRDTNLIGALAKGDSVTMDVGRDLTVRSLQDTDDYSYEQYSLNIAGSYGTGFDGSLGFTMDKMDSTWASVNEQSGIYAGQGGYDITVGKHTQLDGAVIASEATPELNNLDTGTLGWSDIKNRADYDVSHVSMSIGSGGGAPFGFPGVPGTPIVVAYGDSASSTTHAAIADGNITIRDQNNQQQDISRISHDTENAANPLDKIFDADEQMRNLEAIGLAGQIVSQVTTIATNIGVKAAQDEAHAKADAQKDSAANDPAIIAQARADLSKAGNDNPTQEELNKATYDVVYQAEFKIANKAQMEKYGTGSDVQRAIQAAGAALTVAMGGGSVGNAAAAASAPYLAQGVKVLTEGPEMKDKAINAIAHAIIGAAVAQGSGNSAASGAIGAASGEIIAQTITQYLYEGKKPEELTEEQRQAVAALSMIASGAIGGVVGDSTESAATSANAGYNAAVNNHLTTGEKQVLDRKEKEYASTCQGGNAGSGACQELKQDIDKLKEKGSSIDKVEENEFGPDFQLAGTEQIDHKPGDVVSCVGSSNGFCVVTEQSTSNGKEWILAEANEVQAIAAKHQNGDAEAFIKELGAAYFNAGCGTPGGLGISAVCQTYSAAGGANPIDGKVPTDGDRLLWAMEAATNTAGTVLTINQSLSLNYKANIAEHLANFDGFTQSRGIKGGHNANSFYDSVKQYGVQIVSETPTGTPGITTIEYRIPAKHPQTGEITHYKGDGSEPFKKTIYDPKIFTDQKMLTLGKQAAAKAYKDAMLSPKGIADATVGGVTFRVYVDKATGVVRNFHPK